ncbi:hypothetical protein FWF48_00345 [Candidatus Saccharibacteria bacterium]|nr:hypothetical protein [Candidatus Saccharibacteria bacterium]
MSTRRIVLVHNKRSSKAKSVYKKVIHPLEQANLADGQLVKYQITPIGPKNNAILLSRKLHEGDLVIAAGGDGTASIAANAILQTSFSKIHFAALGFGNFNDIARTFPADQLGINKLIAGDYAIEKLRPLEIKANNKRFRYGVLYTSFGLLAGAANQFEDKAKRQKLYHGGANIIYSTLMLLPYYLKNKKRHFLPSFTLDSRQYEAVTDYLAINGSRMAKIFKTGRPIYRKPEFLRVILDVSHFVRTTPYLLESVTGHMPGELSKRDDLIFKTPSHIATQTDGEYEEFLGVDKITIQKAEKYLNMVV